MLAIKTRQRDAMGQGQSCFRHAHHRTMTSHSNALMSFQFFFTGPFSLPKVPPDLARLLPSLVPDWGADTSPEGVKATWLG